jgi:hypothetical protein
MKLYTEEQVKSLLNKMNVIYSLEDLTPIELPSDEEIDDRSYSDEQEKGFRNGAKWMRDKTYGGNK